MAQQTAVEWLLHNIPDLGSYIPFGISMELHAKFQQAKEMEKQQIEDAWDNGNIEAGEECNIYCGEQYYTETYKRK